MSIKLKDIANEAGVSIATVSLVLRDCPVRCGLEKVALIKKIAKENHYTPNYSAVSLVTKKTNTIGVIVPDIENTFFSSLVKRLSRILAKEGYTMLFCEANKDADNELNCIEMLSRRNVDAFIGAFAFDMFDKDDASLIKTINCLSKPHIIIDTHLNELNCPRVAIDHFEGATIAVEHLIKMGHKKIGCITGMFGGYTTRKRLEGYKYALERNDIAFQNNLVYKGDYSFESGYREGLKLLKEDITAIFAFNDMMAYGVIKAAHDLKVKIPEDISIVGFDDIIFSSMTNIALTSISQPIDDMAEIVCSELHNWLVNGNDYSPNQIFKVAPQLIERESVKKII